MDGTGIAAIEKIVKGSHVVEVAGEHYSVNQLKRVYDDPRPLELKVRTLTGLVDFIKSPQGKALIRDESLIHVVSHQQVTVISPPYGESQARDAAISAVVDRPVFGFGQWKDPEEFNIALASMFAPTDDLQAVMAYAGKIAVHNEVLIEDDGVTQHANVKKGVSGGLVEKKRAPSRVTLKPYRTFAEIDQVESEFIFRVRTIEGIIQLALFEADAGAWKDQAATRIKDWIWNHAFDIPVIT